MRPTWRAGWWLPLILTLALWLTPRVTLATDQLLFGPTQVTRAGGLFTQYSATIQVPPTLTAPYRLHVQNGDGAGHHVILAGTVTLNGSVVVAPWEFYTVEHGFVIQPVGSLDKPVTLHPRNTLQVRILGLPGSFLTLSLYGSVPPPTLSSLAPPTLPLTQGTPGTLTATLSAVQPTETTITLQSSAPGIAAVPSTVTVPAQAQTTPIPVTALAPGTATISATLNGSTAQAAVTVQPGSPTLTGLTPGTLQITQGAAGSLTVTLNAAQATETLVTLTSSQPTVVGLPATVAVPAGQLSQPFAVFGTSAGPATVTASLNGSAVQSQVSVVLPLPTVVSLLPPALPLTEGSTGTLTVTVNASQPTATEVGLATSDPAVAGLAADRVSVPAQALSASFPVSGLARGMATVTASLNGSTATSAVTVTPPPAMLYALTCPATLTVGATGLCTLTLSATQLTDTVVPLTSSDPSVVTVPASGVVPAGQLAVPVPVGGLALGPATLTAGPLNGSSRTADLQVVPPPPTLASLLPPTGTLYVGATATLSLSLNAAQLTDTAVPLGASPSAVLGLPASVTVPAGSLTAPVTVTGLTPGTATLTAGPLNGTQAQSTLSVNQLPPTLTSLAPASLSLPKGLIGSLTLTIAPTQPAATVVPLTSSDPTTVEVPPSLTIPAGASTATSPVLTRNVGTATLTAGPLNGSSQTVPVTVTAPELVSLTITPPAPAIAKGETQAFTATGTYTDGTTQDLTSTAAWTSSDATIATLAGSGGLATSKAEGQVTISATVGPISATASLTVTAAILHRLAVTPEAPSLRVGETLQLQALGTLTDGTTQDVTAAVTWTSSAATVATMSSTGLATALAAGAATITATHPDGFTASTTLTVLHPPPTVTKFNPSSGKAGTVVTITGAYLGSTTSVSFNGTTAPSVSIASPTTITATVPPAATSGPLTVTTPGGSVTTASSFLVLPTQDVTLSVEPALVTAIAGTTVSLTVRTTAAGGFTGLTQLGVDALPEGVTASFAPPALGPNATGVLTLTTTATTPSAATITIRGTTTIEGSPITRTASATLSVQPVGQTVLAGQVRDEDDKPLAGVTLKLGGSTITTLGVTDVAGNFLVPVPVAGAQVFLIDGTTANLGSVSYATIPVTVVIQPGIVNTLGFTPRLHAQPTTQPLPVAPATATPITFANLPDLQLTIPAGVRILGWDGQANTQIGVRLVPLDRLALPAPPAGVATNTVYMFSFGKVGGGTPTQPIPVTFPNTVGAYPGQQVELWHYNEAPDGSRPNTWQSYGLGTVSNDGRLIVSNPGVGIPQFCCGAGYVRIPPPPQNTPPDETTQDPSPDPTDCCTGGDPVELSSGIFLHEQTDLTLPGRLPVVLRRLYRTNSPTVGPFGVGTSTSYDAYLRQKTSDLVILFLPGNYKSRWAKQPDGSFTVGDKGTFRGARLTKNGDATWTLRYKDGRLWQVNSVGWLVAQQNRNGNVLIIQRDSQNRLTTLREPGGRELTLSYSGSDTKIQSVTDPLGRQVRYTYDGSNRLTAVTDPANGTWQYTYDSGHRMRTVTNPRQVLQTQNTYDAAGRVATQTLADTGVTRFDYTVVAGTIAATTVTDPTGVARTYRFSGGYNTEATDGLGQSTKTLRRAGTNLVQVQTDPLGRTTQFQYDSAGNITQLTDALNQPWASTYDPTFNHVRTSEDPLHQTTTFGYDGKGNLTSVTDPLNHPTTLGYNALGDLVSVTDALNHTNTFEYDSVGNLTATVDPLGNRTERTYDAVSRLIAVKDPKGALTQFSYDALDRVARLADPLNGITRFTHDPLGNLLTVTDAKTQTTTHTYTAMNRLETRTDPLNRTESLTYDLNGNLKTVTDRKNQLTTHTYDAQNRRIRTDYADGASVSFSYDPVGNLRTATDSLTGTITRSYDALNRLAEEITPQGAITYTYDAASRRQTMQASGLPPVSYGYDATSRLTGIVQGPQTASLTYDPANRRTTLVLPTGITVGYQYDNASRLIAQTYTGLNGPLGDLSYSYDATGNRLATGGSWARSLLPTSVLATTYDLSNAQLAFGDVSQTFDANGNLLTQTDASGTTTYTWDARDRLTALSGPTISAGFAYDALGRRVAKTINGQSTSALYDGLDSVRESGPGGEAAYLRTLAIDEAVSRTDGTGTLSYLADALGSPVALADDTGALPTTYTYAPFGDTAVSGPSANPVQFTGRENDGTGLYYYRARYYDPVRGRFVSEDPLGFRGGISKYAYVINNPMIWIDPWGLAWTDWQSVTATIEATTAQGARPSTSYGFDPNSDQFIALPSEGLQGRWVELETNGITILVPVGDVGPWNGGHTNSGRSLNDPYWDDNKSPQAECGTDLRGRRTNRAGMDISSDLARALGLRGTTQVRWRGLP